MTQRSIGNYEASWGEYGADEWSDAMVASMKLGGVDNLFFVSGSEIAFWQESVAKANEREWPAPRLITVTHEGVALNAAAGDAGSIDGSIVIRPGEGNQPVEHGERLAR